MKQSDMKYNSMFTYRVQKLKDFNEIEAILKGRRFFDVYDSRENSYDRLLTKDDWHYYKKEKEKREQIKQQIDEKQLKFNF